MNFGMGIESHVHVHNIFGGLVGLEYVILYLLSVF